MTQAEIYAADSLVHAYFDLYPHEAAELLEDAPADEVAEMLNAEQPVRAARVFRYFNADFATDVLMRMDASVLNKLIAVSEPGFIASVFARLDENDCNRRLEEIDSSLAAQLRELMDFPAGTAGYLMDPRVLSFRGSLTVDEVLSKLHTLRERRVRDLFLTNDEGQLFGAVPLHEVILAEPDQRLEQLVRSQPPSVNSTSLQDEIVETLAKSKLSSLPVVDYDGRLIGTIRQDALVQAIQEQATAGMLTMVGVSKSERALSTPIFAVRKRLPWLNINLVTAFLAAAVVGLFESTIAQFTALAVLLPVVAGQSGNTGAQALAVTMRGLALREIGVRHSYRVMLKEVVVGFVNGVSIAIITSFGVYVWSGSPGLCMVIGIAMVVSMAIAGLSGALIPMFLTKIGQDPAQSSSIILTTVTDVVGFFSFLGLATVLSGML